MRVLLGLLVPLALFGCSSSGASNSPAQAKPSRSLAENNHLPESARALLSDRMQHHGQAMSDIVWSVLFLDYEAAADIAEEIANEPQLARPLRREAGELNSLLPETFYDLQDELVERARLLASAARLEDPAQVSKAMGDLSGTCVRCHSTYLGAR